MGKLARPGVTVPVRWAPEILWRAQRFAEFGVPRRRHAAFNARWAPSTRYGVRRLRVLAGESKIIDSVV